MNNEIDTQLMTPHATKAVMEYAARHAQRLGHDSIDTGHLLLGLMSTNPRTNETSPVAERLRYAFGIELAEVREAVESIDRATPRPKSAADMKVVLKRAERFAKRDKKSGRHKVLVITRFHIAAALVDVADPMFLQILKVLEISRAQFVNAMEGKRVLLTAVK